VGSITGVVNVMVYFYHILYLAHLRIVAAVIATSLINMNLISLVFQTLAALFTCASMSKQPLHSIY